MYIWSCYFETKGIRKGRGHYFSCWFFMWCLILWCLKALCPPVSWKYWKIGGGNEFCEIKVGVCPQTDWVFFSQKIRNNGRHVTQKFPSISGFVGDDQKPLSICTIVCRGTAYAVEFFDWLNKWFNSVVCVCTTISWNFSKSAIKHFIQWNEYQILVSHNFSDFLIIMLYTRYYMYFRFKCDTQF